MVQRSNTTYDLVDKLLKGTLAKKLSGWREKKLTLTQCADKVAELTGVVVSRETVRRWLDRG